MSVFCLQRETGFDVTYELTIHQRRNQDLEGRDDRQMTFLNFNSYVQNVGVFCIPDGRTNRQTDREINLVWAG